MKRIILVLVAILIVMTSVSAQTSSTKNVYVEVSGNGVQNEVGVQQFVDNYLASIQSFQVVPEIRQADFRLPAEIIASTDERQYLVSARQVQRNVQVETVRQVIYSKVRNPAIQAGVAGAAQSVLGKYEGNPNYESRVMKMDAVVRMQGCNNCGLRDSFSRGASIYELRTVQNQDGRRVTVIAGGATPQEIARMVFLTQNANREMTEEEISRYSNVDVTGFERHYTGLLTLMRQLDKIFLQKKGA